MTHFVNVTTEHPSYLKLKRAWTPWDKSQPIHQLNLLEWEVNGPLLEAREGPKMIRTRVQNKPQYKDPTINCHAIKTRECINVIQNWEILGQEIGCQSGLRMLVFIGWWMVSTHN
ncbi:hypothetical protein EV702DRAFT_1042592 [Suillus placidus]|uniref:Uncharacterized protein n=1 Tax=Suillus placidus TaxID=48579 RepID=A0A9P7A1Y5_9AGAM|nr:hypothetical protein EV702DRAFT_1042592 [Suillus placidus]